MVGQGKNWESSREERQGQEHKQSLIQTLPTHSVYK